MSTRLHSCTTLLLTLTFLYYGGGLTFAYASSQVAVETGSIHGEVVDSVTGAPVARARVGVTPIQDADRGPLEAATDADGKFVFAGVPAGEYTWSVRKSGYLTAPSGGRPTLRNMARKRIVVSPEQRLRLRVPLAPASVMLGRVLAPDGEPIEFARVALFRVPYPGARPRPVESSSDGTNDAGEFRIPRVTPGSYLLLSWPGQSSIWSDGGMLVNTWYPGTASVAGATAIEVTPGSMVSGLDMTLHEVKPVTVSGTVIDRAGRPVDFGSLQIFTERDGTRVNVSLATGSDESLEPDGAFRLRLSPGEYRLVASAHGSGGIGSVSGPPESTDPVPDDMQSIFAAINQELRASGFASMKIDVGGEGLEGITLKLEPPISIAGRLVFEGRQPPPEIVMSADVGLRAAADGHGCQDREDAGLGLAFGPAFEIFASPGTCIPTVTPPPGWHVKAIQLGGVDVTQRIVTLEQGQSPGELRVILTERRNEVSFSVADARGAATKEYVAMVFPVDESRWAMNPSAMNQVLRLHVPRADGTSARGELHGTQQGPHSDYSEQLGGLVPGEYYAIAIDDAAWEDLVNPVMLRRLSEKAIKFQIGEGETRRLDLKRVDLAGF